MPQPSLAEAAQTSATFVGSLFVVEGADALVAHRLDRFGIVPRTLEGLIGIVFGPLLHANWAHLVANALPLFVLLLLLLLDRHYRPWLTLALIWVASGLGTWLIGRNAEQGRLTVHIGASSVIYGLVAYLIVAGFLMKSWRPALISILVLFLYGGIFFGVLPQAGPISWEGHLSGALAGVWAAKRNHA
jgi:membrane associated rhomboid family serine protease